MDPELEIATLANQLEDALREFLTKADPSGKLTEILNIERQKVNHKFIVDLAIYLFPRFDQYTNLMAAYWANRYLPTLAIALEKHGAQTTAELKRRLLCFGVDLNIYENLVKPWFDGFKANTALHASTSVPFLATVKSLLMPYLPVDGKTQQEIDAALSAAGLPTSTESEESWLKRLMETQH